MIETELKCLLSDEEYNRLRVYFDAQAKLEQADNQITYYYSGPADLRIQKNNSGAKIVVKSGVVHDLQREEIEVLVAKDQFNKLEKLFMMAGYEIAIKWFRYRRQYQWRGITVCLDDTVGYGYILELERLTPPAGTAGALSELRSVAQELGVTVTSRAKLNRQFDYYQQHWRRLIPDHAQLTASARASTIKS